MADVRRMLRVIDTMIAESNTLITAARRVLDAAKESSAALTNGSRRWEEVNGEPVPN